jgi:hypothetical protein
VTEVLPALFDLRDSLSAAAADTVPITTTAADDEQSRPTPAVVRIAAYAAVLMIDKYLDLIWDCDIYVIAIGTYTILLVFLFLTQIYSSNGP